jgi:RHS repeat-associated protein
VFAFLAHFENVPLVELRDRRDPGNHRRARGCRLPLSADPDAPHLKRGDVCGHRVRARTYDPLDRTASRTDHLGAANQKTTAFAYLGLSEQLISERDAAGALLKSYQYSPWGERLSQVKRDTGGAAEDSYYGYTPHTDVETLTPPSGDTRATYGYTAYGNGNDDATAFTGVDKPDPANPQKEAYNPYRYTGKRLDPAFGNYDMGFREYDPGLNQFLTRDLYNGALADMTLATNPWTNNRYAFTGGNPITRHRTRRALLRHRNRRLRRHRHQSRRLQR